MIRLPTTVRNRAVFRILTMPEGSWTPEASQVWTALPIPLIFNRTDPVFGATSVVGTSSVGGYHVQSITRSCLPDEDKASFYIDIGTINGVTVAAQDLDNTAIRIQVADDETFPSGISDLSGYAGWKTVFVGTVIAKEQSYNIGSRENGRVTYYCAGELSRTRKCPLDRHSTADVEHAKGHPGYNVPLHGWFRKVLGNRDDVDVTGHDPWGDLADIADYYQSHALPVGSGGAYVVPWTDLDVVKHAVTSSRSLGEPLFYVDLAADAFGGSYAWQVNPGDSCWDLLRRICNRQRGRGSVYLDYDDVSGPDGPVRMTIKSRPSFIGNLYYNTVATYGDLTPTRSNQITGAEMGVDAIDVDLVGDHRVTENGFSYENRQSTVYDVITIQGEPIQVLCNLNFFGGSFAKRWSDVDEATFGALPIDKPWQRMLPRWRQVWRRFGIPNGWDFTVTSVPGGFAHNIDYHMTMDGTIQSGAGLASVMNVRILPDLPIYEGWRYDTYPLARFDGGSEYLPPDRMPPVVLMQGDTNASGGDPAWLPLQYAQFNLQVDDFGLYIVHPTEDATGIRFLSNATDAPSAFQSPSIPGVSTVSGVDLNKLNTIVGVELGARCAMDFGGIYDYAGRRLTITISGIHLWLGAPGAIWELDYSRASQLNYAPGLLCNGSPTILRDDRDALSLIGTLSGEYYLNAHNPGTWALYDCGLMSSFETADNGSIEYPKLGQMVANVTYATDSNGAPSKAALNTGITCIHYDHASGTTTWKTDYIAYDGNTQ